jgi:hypothetical protein
MGFLYRPRARARPRARNGGASFIVPFDNFGIRLGMVSRLIKDQHLRARAPGRLRLGGSFPPGKLTLAESVGDRYYPLPRESDLYGAVR